MSSQQMQPNGMLCISSGNSAGYKIWQIVYILSTFCVHTSVKLSLLNSAEGLALLKRQPIDRIFQKGEKYAIYDLLTSA